MWVWVGVWEREHEREDERAPVRVRAVVADEAERGQASSHQVLTDSYERHDGMQRNGTATTSHSVRS